MSGGTSDDRTEGGTDDEAESFGDTSEAGPTPEAAPDQESDDEPDEVFEGYGRYEAFPAEEEYHTALPRKMEAWRQRSATGAILTGMALGLQQALGKEREEPAIVVQTSGDPPRDLPVEADFEFRRPRQSVVNIRPWLLDGSDSTEPEPNGAAEAPVDEGRSEPPER